MTKAKTKSCTPGMAKNSSGKQRILDCILAIEMQQKHHCSVPRKAIAACSGVKSNTFVVTLSMLKKQGLIEYDTDSIRLTDKGRDKANPCAVPLDNSLAQENMKLRNKLGGKALLMFEALLDGHVHDRVALAKKIGCTNKATLSVMLSNLKKKGVLVYDCTTIQLSDACFPFGRPSCGVRLEDIPW